MRRLFAGQDFQTPVGVGIRILLTIQVHALLHEAVGRWSAVNPVASHFWNVVFSSNILSVLTMASTLDEDVRALKEGIRGGWRRLADPALTSFDRRETRNYMKEAELALSVGLRRIADREQSRREAEAVSIAKKSLDFRILRLDA